jgi:hypothetical protein
MGATFWFHKRVLQRWNLRHILVVDAESTQVGVMQFVAFYPHNSHYFSQATPKFLLFDAKVGGLFICTK